MLQLMRRIIPDVLDVAESSRRALRGFKGAPKFSLIARLSMAMGCSPVLSFALLLQSHMPSLISNPFQQSNVLVDPRRGYSVIALGKLDAHNARSRSTARRSSSQFFKASDPIPRRPSLKQVSCLSRIARMRNK